MIKQNAASEREQPLNEGSPLCYVGVNVGALTVKVVAVQGDKREARVAAHLGRPAEVVRQLLATNSGFSSASSSRQFASQS